MNCFFLTGHGITTHLKIVPSSAEGYSSSPEDCLSHYFSCYPQGKMRYRDLKKFVKDDGTVSVKLCSMKDKEFFDIRLLIDKEGTVLKPTKHRFCIEKTHLDYFVYELALLVDVKAGFRGISYYSMWYNDEEDLFYFMEERRRHGLFKLTPNQTKFVLESLRSLQAESM